jgi:outer membrane lipoprotein-sorting protein
VRRREPSEPSSSSRRRPLLEATVAAGLALVAACATTSLPPPQVVAAAAAADSYSGSLRVSVKGPDVRGRTRVLLAFRRPDAIRIEIPGPSGARLVAVVSGGRLTAVLPAERAVFEGPAERSDLGALLGVALTPAELMDVIVGVAPPEARLYHATWGEALPRRVEAVLGDGTHLKATVDDAESDARLPEAAFDPPPHPGYRPVDAEEARRLLGGH